MIRVELKGGVAKVTLSNPPVNAIRVEDAVALRDAFEDFLTTGEPLCCVLLRAEGRGFSAGMDIKEMEVSPGMGLMMESGAAFEACFKAMDNCPVPIVVAVDGFCMGVGLALVSCCDILVASPGAKFGVPEGAWGIVHLARLVPPMKLRQMALTGDPIRSEELLSCGSVDRIVPSELLDSECEKIALRFKMQSPNAPRLSKSKLIEITGSSHPNFSGERDHTFRNDEVRRRSGA
jgi:enoyl-CoA hydratase